MANNYTEFAFYMERKTFGDSVLNDIDDIMALSSSVEDDEEEFEKFPAWFVLSEEEKSVFIDFGGHGCNCEMDKNGLYIGHEESGNADIVAIIIQKAMQRNNSEACAGFEYAYTCSKARPGEFGGGACFITKDGTEWMSGGMWLSEKLSGHTEKQEQGAVAPTPG